MLLLWNTYPGSTTIKCSEKNMLFKFLKSRWNYLSVNFQAESLQLYHKWALCQVFFPRFHQNLYWLITFYFGGLKEHFQSLLLNMNLQGKKEKYLKLNRQTFVKVTSQKKSGNCIQILDTTVTDKSRGPYLPLPLSICALVVFPLHLYQQLPFFSIFMNIFMWCHGIVTITVAQLHSTKPEFRFCTGLNPVCVMSEIHKD